MGDTCSIWAVKLYWLDKFLLNTVTDQDIILLVPDSFLSDGNRKWQWLSAIFTNDLYSFIRYGRNRFFNSA
jgi:hypothetical protein